MRHVRFERVDSSRRRDTCAALRGLWPGRCLCDPRWRARTPIQPREPAAAVEQECWSCATGCRRRVQATGDCIVPGAQITQGTDSYETDLLGWNGHRLLTAEAKAAASLFTINIIAQDLEAAVSIGATSYALICPQRLSTSLIEETLEIAEEYDIEVLQLTGAELLNNAAPYHAFIQVAAEQGS